MSFLIPNRQSATRLGEASGVAGVGNRQFPELRPADLLLYGGGSLISWLIQFRTWSDVSHVEIYLGGGRCLASRANGVDIYPLRVLNLRRVLRPVAQIRGSTGDSPVPSGDPPDGTETTIRANRNDLFPMPRRHIPFGGISSGADIRPGPDTMGADLHGRSSENLPLNFQAGLQWFRSVQGTRYGYSDLLKFYLIDIPTQGMICSEFADRFFRASGLPLFNPRYPSGAVCPRDYETLSPILADQIWNWK